MEIKSLHKVYSNRKLKVAAYARISNDKESLETSLEEQVDSYTRIIVSNPQWEFAGIYYDDGISGTSTTFRKGFLNMIENARAGLIDIILVKSISRFARNIIDLLTLVRELRKKGIEIYFESQNISSLDTKCDQMITMYAEFAEEEALSVSENVRWRVKKNMFDGKYYLPVNQMLGYRYDEKGKIIIYEPEAKIIRKIYSLCLEGKGCIEISKYLVSNQIPNRKGNVSWATSTIRQLLRNEKYVGDYLYHKSYIEDPLTHKCKINHGEVEQYIVKNGHPAIIDREDWDKVQELLTLKAQKFNVRTYEKGNYNLAKQDTTFTGFIKCPYCGKNYITKLNHYNGEASNRHLMCSSNRYTKSCKSENYPFEVFKKIVLKQIKILKGNVDLFKEALYEDFQDANKESRESEIKALDKQISELRDEFSKIEHLFDDFCIDMKKGLVDKIGELTKKKVCLQNESITAGSIDMKVANIIKTLKNIPNEINDFKESNFKELFSKAIIVNKKLVYFIIGNPEMDKYPIKPNLRFKGNIRYTIRITEFNTNFGIIINR